MKNWEFHYWLSGYPKKLAIPLGRGRWDLSIN
jgi:hypothetical protein